MFPFGFTLEDFKTGVSRVRNRVIARVFSELNLMETWGSGYKRVVEACKVDGYPEPEWQELGSAIRVIFYPHTKASLDDRNTIDTSIQEDLAPRQKVILSLFSIGESLPFRQIVEKLPLKISERSLRYDLTRLFSLGFLVSKGRGRAVYWQRVR